MVVDASVWVSAFWASDTHHAASVAWLREIVRTGTPIIEPRLLSVEIGAAIARRTDKPVLARRAVDMLNRLEAITWVALDDHLAALATQAAIDLRMRGADAIYVAVAHMYGVSLATWDAEQTGRAAGFITVVSPSS